MKKILLSASLMCANFKNLKEDLEALEKGGIDIIHVDIMDGHFVPNITLSPLIIESLKNITNLPFDAHLMVENPNIFIDDLIKIGTEIITLHIEVISNYAFRIIDKIKKANKKLGIAINPATPIDNLEYIYPLVDKITIMTVDPGFARQAFIPNMQKKIKRLSDIKRKNSYNFLIEVDGGINKKTFSQVIKNGANSLILGTSGLFDVSHDLETTVKNVRALINTYVNE